MRSFTTSLIAAAAVTAAAGLAPGPPLPPTCGS